MRVAAARRDRRRGRGGGGRDTTRLARGRLARSRDAALHLFDDDRLAACRAKSSGAPCPARPDASSASVFDGAAPKVFSPLLFVSFMRLSKRPGSGYLSVRSRWTGRRSSSVAAATGGSTVPFDRYAASRRTLYRKAALASPAPSAACITFVLPNAKSNWREAKRFIRAMAASASPKRPLARRSSLAVPSAAPSLAWMSASDVAAADRRLDLGRSRHDEPGFVDDRQELQRVVLHDARRPRSARSDGASAFVLKPRENACFRAASATVARARAVVQTPRPGSLRRRSGTTSPPGDSAKRIIASGAPFSPVTMQVRCDPILSGFMRAQPSFHDDAAALLRAGLTPRRSVVSGLRLLGSAPPRSSRP